MSTPKHKILVISDTQAPFHHPDTLAFLKAIKNKYKPTKVVHIGDLTDGYCLSNYVKDPDAISANEEIKQMLEFTGKISKMFPKVDILTSNHGARLQRAAVRAGIPSYFLKSYNEWKGLPDTWVFHDEVIIDDIIFTHGEEAGAGGQAASSKRMMHYGRSSVAGHLHTQANITYFANREKLMFGMQVGCLIDRKQLAFHYCKKSLKKPILTVGFIDKGIPVLIPMLLNDSGRWVGKL